MQIRSTSSRELEAQAMRIDWLLCALIFVCTNIAWSPIVLTVRCHLTSRGLKMVFSLPVL